ncbi:MAG TPA: toll/interleukin-1 receptor domain-containing protein, partial [Aggregatilineales bacterium]|nr:toll/interleukin-1 receptor domain-containing protein [Aggregatilineales bacterium]
MSDVFISYSREDKAFVALLREAFLKQSQEVWIDWESIPASQAWWDEIKRGIATANNFVVVMSLN